MREHNNKNLFAFALILFGILLVFKTFNMPFLQDFNLGFIIGLIWPLFILVPGLNSLRRRFNIGGLILVLIGGSFLLDNFLDVFGMDIQVFWFMKFFWPALLIYLGFKMLSPKKHREWDESYENFDEQSYARYNAMPADRETITFNSKKFHYGMDNMSEEIVKLDLNITFGGAEIIVEEGIQVVLIGQYTFGGHEFFGYETGGVQREIKEVRYHDDRDYDKTLLINASITFGGIEVTSR